MKREKSSMDYRVSFFKLVKEQDEKKRTIVTGQEYLGSIVVDDNGSLDIISKAYRHASGKLLNADKVKVEAV